jgi:hypothetical protein
MGWLTNWRALFDWTRMTSIPFEDEVLGPLATVYLVLFALGFLAAGACYWRPPRQLAGNGLNRRLTRRFAMLFLWVFGVGLVFFGFRAMGLPFLGIRLWLYVMVLALLAAVGYVVYYLRARYPAERAAYEAQQLKRRYQQAGRRRPTAGGVEVPRSARAEKRRQRSGSRSR